MKMIDTPPILITGAARSGTSLVAGTINLCGAFGGNMSGPNRNNAKGMFENTNIRNTIVKPYLREIGVDALGQYPLPNINRVLKPIHGLADKVSNIMVQQGYQGGPWMYKGAKLCLIWPLWHQAFPSAKWIIVRRSPEDIAASCVRTGFMRAFSRSNFRRAIHVNNEYEGWLWWAQQHEERFQTMKDAGLNIKEVWPDKMVSGEYKAIIETINWLGLNWNADALSFVDPRLWKNRSKAA
jgi:hypothetical protein